MMFGGGVEWTGSMPNSQGLTLAPTSSFSLFYVGVQGSPHSHFGSEEDLIRALTLFWGR